MQSQFCYHLTLHDAQRHSKFVSTQIDGLFPYLVKKICDLKWDKERYNFSWLQILIVISFYGGTPLKIEDYIVELI